MRVRGTIGIRGSGRWTASQLAYAEGAYEPARVADAAARDEAFQQQVEAYRRKDATHIGPHGGLLRRVRTMWDGAPSFFQYRCNTKLLGVCGFGSPCVRLPALSPYV